MKVAKWGNSLAVRLPKEYVEALGLEEGSDIAMTLIDGKRLEIERSMTRDEAITLMQTLKRPLPPNYKFNREELHERPGHP